MQINKEIDNLLASIDPSLLEPLPHIGLSEEDSHSEGEETGIVDPELLKELDELKIHSEDEVNVPVIYEDSKIMKELAALISNEGAPDVKITPRFSEQQLRQRQFGLKSAAVAFKKGGDLAAAKRQMNEAKRLDEAISLASAGLPLGSEFILPEVPKIPHINKCAKEAAAFYNCEAPMKKEEKDSKPPPQVSLANQFDSLMVKLEAQADMASRLARQFFQFEDRSNALRFQRYRKGFQKQMEQVEASRLHINPILPPTRTEVVTFSLPPEELEVAPNVVEVWVGRAWGLYHPRLGDKPPDSFVQYSLGFNRKSGYSPVAYQTADPNYDFTARLAIDGSRAWQRHVERKSLTIEVLHYRGFLFQYWPLGKAAIPLAPLLRRPRLEQTVELVHPTSRRPTGARIQIRVKIRRPILPQPAQQTRLEWVAVLPPAETNSLRQPASHDPNNQATSISKINPDDKVKSIVGFEGEPGEASLTKPREGLKPDASKEAPPRPAFGATTLPSEPKAADGLPEDEKRAALSEYYSVNRIVAKTALELELERLATSSELPPLPSGWDLSARRAELELKLNMLEVQAQLGQMDPSAYLAQLYASLSAHKALAVHLKKAQCLAHARQVLFHIKAIQTEVDELVTMGVTL